MNIALISLFVPTPENYNGASALPYHIIKNRGTNKDIDVYTWNLNHVNSEQINKIESELNISITILSVPLLMSIFINTPIFSLRTFLKYPYLRYLSIGKRLRNHLNSQYNAIWIYGEEISGHAKYFNKRPTVITTPDCEAMYYARVISMPEKILTSKFLIKYGIMYQKYLSHTRNLPHGKNIKYHLVGAMDCNFLTSINPNVSAYFIPHPHYDYNASKVIDFTKRELKLLIAGRYDFYMKEAADEAINALIGNPALAETYKITFLGRGWESHTKSLKNVGYDVLHITFVPVYSEELIKHDIQLSPISLGTGTKGKVLDAFVNGLLVIGTERALENIQADDHKDYYLYKTGDELIEILNHIASHREQVKIIAQSGCDTVRHNHGQSVIADKFFNLFDHQ